MENRSTAAPNAYILNDGWALNDADLDEFAKSDPSKEGREFNKNMAEMLKATKSYIDPSSRVIAPDYMAKKTELNKYITGETTKMVLGQRPIDDWDKMVQEYLSKGGQEVIDEVNKEIQANKLQGEWK
ncbi:hypothetical protein ACFPYJ_10580 [Paenibacillus solisilvae]|uniref:Extracellular solute-binding protein n=1 Tax=Paenibacillus solisilvae TaxID=2486751 RepID=A0ABW0VZH0_9BACL